ncbi:MAG TPA: hypothetical protein VFV34_16315 [Blastocatellia bacterium]|nr:hypothetical protein [Blastocatellia bacterium]
MLENLNLQVFSGVLNSSFHLRVNDSLSVEMDLVEVNDLGSTASHEQFSLIFLSRKGVLLPQQIFALEHEKLGSLELFIVPIRKDANGVFYEAIFNRNRAAGS